MVKKCMKYILFYVACVYLVRDTGSHLPVLDFCSSL